MRVAFALANKPQAHQVQAVRAGGQCRDFWFLHNDSFHGLIPMKGAHEGLIADFLPLRGGQTSMDDASTEIGQLAADMALQLKAQAPVELMRQIDVIIVCTTGVDSPVGVSLAGKVKHIFDTPQALPFTIGQMDGCSAFEALRIARAFIEGPERARVVAIVANERWWYPYFRSFGDYAQYGDGAAAMLLCAQAPMPQDNQVGTGFEIVDVAQSRYSAQRGPFDLEKPRWFNTEAWSQVVGDFLADFLRKHNLNGADLTNIHSPCLDAVFIDAVARASCLSLSSGTGGFVSSVDPMLALSWPMHVEHVPGYGLSWSVGLNGEMGACLYRSSHGAQVSVRESL